MKKKTPFFTDSQSIFEGAAIIYKSKQSPVWNFRTFITKEKKYLRCSLKTKDINTAIVFALIDGVRIEGCVRTKASSVSVPALCQDLGGKYGKGGGKLGKGAYRYDLGGASVDEDEDEEIRQKCWELFEKKEIKRVSVSAEKR